ncbi:MAG: hypothetical protein AAB426_01440 [Myxococcota bacterium]
MHRINLPMVLVLALATLGGCPSNNGGTDVVDPGDDNPTDPPPVPSETSLTWSISTVCTGTETTTCEAYGSARAAGIQGKLARAPDGTLYYAYLKYEGDNGTCDIAVFGGGPVPNSRYDLKVAVRAPGAAFWQVETVPLDEVPAGDNLPYLGARYGLDGLYDETRNELVLVFAAGGPGLASCASSDLVVARRSVAGAWSFAVPASDSGACCAVCDPAAEGLACCLDPSCNAGTDVGAWAAVALDGAGNLGVSFTDYHNYWDQDGYHFVGYELWEEDGGVRGIRPWSGKGDFGDLVYAGGMPIVAFTSYAGGGLYVARQTGAATADDAWEEQNLGLGWQVGERINLAVAPDGTVGLTAFVAADAGGPLADLVYTQSADQGATWEPFEVVDHQLLDAGRMPSLAFDRASRPGVSYQLVVTGGTSGDTRDLRFAWREEAGPWHVFDVDQDATRVTGAYSQLIFDPDTDAPVIVYQDVTRGAAMTAEGRLP